MIKQLLLGATLATAALASAPLLAEPADHRHGQNAQCTGTNCAAATAATEGRGHHAMGRGSMHGNMHAVRGEHQGKGAHGKRGAQGANAGEGCPMHSERKPT